MREPLRKYLAGVQSFDYVAVSEVYDMRVLQLTWSDFSERVGTPLPKQRAGYPLLRGSQVFPRLDTLLALPGVVRRPAPT